MNFKKCYITLACAGMALAATAQNADTAAPYDNNGRHKGLDFNVSVGYHAGVGDNFKNMGQIPFEVGLGKQFSSNLYFGLNSGVWLGTKGSDPMIPIAADFKTMFPIKGNDVKPIFSLRLGYVVNTQSVEGMEIPDYFMMEIMPGVQIPVTRTNDFMLSAGYTHNFATKGGGGGGFFAVKAGFNFHKDPNKKKRPPREKVPTREHGFQLTFEGGGNLMESMGGGGNLVGTYKINPHFSVGAGAGYEIMSPFDGGDGVASSFEDGDDIQFLLFNINGASEGGYSYQGDVTAYRFFLRGVYRVTDRRWSPFISLDAGIGMLSYDDNLYGGFYDKELKALLGDPQGTQLFASPAVGLSVRTTNNSYIELKAGYRLAPNMEGKKGYSADDLMFAASKSKKMGAPFVTVGFTHTFGKRGKRPAF